MRFSKAPNLASDYERRMARIPNIVSAVREMVIPEGSHGVQVVSSFENNRVRILITFFLETDGDWIRGEFENSYGTSSRDVARLQRHLLEHRARKLIE